MSLRKTFILRIYRGTFGHQYWEEFSLDVEPGMNVISALMDIQKDPLTREGKATTPVVWDQGCLEEICGSCSMLINAYPRQACSALIEPLLEKSSVILLAPLTKFPLIRDLVVDRTSLFEALKRVRAWISTSTQTSSDEEKQHISPELQQSLYLLSTCMTCGCCSEACPQVSERSDFMGPAAVSQARLFNDQPLGKEEQAARARAMLAKDGIAGCANAQNCGKVCPKGIRLTESISIMGRQATKQFWKEILGHTEIT